MFSLCIGTQDQRNAVDFKQPWNAFNNIERDNYTQEILK